MNYFYQRIKMKAVNLSNTFCWVSLQVFSITASRNNIYDTYILLSFNSRWHLNASVFKVCKKSIASSGSSSFYMTNKNLMSQSKHFIFGLDIYSSAFHFKFREVKCIIWITERYRKLNPIRLNLGKWTPWQNWFQK